MPYAELPREAGKTLDLVMKYHRGVCHHAAYMSCALARANGIPAYVVGGDRLPGEKEFKDAVTSHGWICVKLSEKGWVELESLDPGSLYTFTGDGYLRFAHQEAMDNTSRTSLQAYPISGKRLQ